MKVKKKWVELFFFANEPFISNGYLSLVFRKKLKHVPGVFFPYSKLNKYLLLEVRKPQSKSHL